MADRTVGEIRLRTPYQDDRFFEMLDHYSGGQYETNEVELIINSDFFDPLAVATNWSVFPAEVTEDEAVRKFEHISGASSPTVFEALKQFTSAGEMDHLLYGETTMPPYYGRAFRSTCP